MRIRELRTTGHWPTLLSAFVYFDVSFMIWVLIGALGIFIAQDFQLSATLKGFVVAVPILAGSLLRLPMGIAVDRFGPRRMGALGLILTVLPLLLGFIGARGLGGLIVVGLLLGVAGASFAVALPLASRWYPPRLQGLVMGIAGAGNSGTVVAAFLAPRLAERVGWHTVFGLAMIPLAAALVVFALLAKDSPAQPAARPLGEYLAVLRVADTWWFNLFYMVTFGGFVGLASFLPIFFHDQFGISRIMAGNLTALCVLVGSFLRPVGGALADRFGGLRVLTALYAAIGSIVLGVSLLPALPLTTLLLFATMSGLGMGNGSVFQLVPQRFRDEIGVVTGLVGAAGGFGGFLLPFFIGLLKDVTGSYGTGFFVFGLTGFSCMGLLLYVQGAWRTWARADLEGA
ncbi:MAG: NarK/NasA family nitrate transporter [Candidatus Rokubacteria bacterium]|nr:NarK/NasA family nitrate transporter [Candidatus Rokubacteria bacterium]